MRMRIAATLLLALTLGLVVASHRTDDVFAADEQPVLRVGSDSRVHSLDPHEAMGAMELHIAEALFEGLTYIDPKTLEPVPGVAESWTVSEDRRTWTFTLRKEARWSDGQPVTATDFARSFRRSLHPAFASEWALLFHNVCGARAYNEYGRAAEALARNLHDRSYAKILRAFAAKHPEGVDRATWRAWPWSVSLPDLLAVAPEPLAREAWLGRRARWSAEDLATLATSLETAARRLHAAWKTAHDTFGRTLGITPVDPHTLRIELTEPQPWLLQALAMPCAAPVPPAVSGRGTPPGTRAVPSKRHWWAQATVVVNGPYRPVEFRAFRKPGVRLEANKAYWNAASIRQKRIDVISVEDPMAGLRQFVDGSLAWSQSWPFKMVKALRKADTFRVSESQIAYYYLFQCEHPAMADPRVRRALAKSVDRTALIEKALHGFGRPAETLVPAGLPGYVAPKQGLAFDPAAARALLTAAGHPGGKGLPEIVILCNSHSQHEAIAEGVATGWRRHLGVRVSVRSESWLRYKEAKHAGEFMVARMGWIGDYADPMTFLALFETGNPGNDGGWSHEGFDRLLASARGEADPAKRLRILAEAESLMLLEGTACAPFYWYRTGDLVQPWLHGFRTRADGPTPSQPGRHNVQGLHPFRGLWVERRK